MAIDYKDVGQRIKEKRIERGLTQEKLSELVGIGPSHMSHIESGSTVPSFEVFISILNALNCSADELLCREVAAAKPLLNSWLSDIIEDCDPTETKILSDIVISAKQTLRKNKRTE
jgi:transcriptional regulator with XRE-family HTH domain